mgnify:CR=1 FL=1
MMTLNYQLSIFGKYSIEPTPDIISDLMGRINTKLSAEFIPSALEVPNVDIENKTVSINTNLRFITLDRRFSIVLLNDRIDVNYNKASEEEEDGTKFFHMAEQTLSLIMEYFNLHSNRLAMNIQQVFVPISSTALNSIGKQCLKCSAYYDDKSFDEWSTRVNSQTEFLLNNTAETVNVITIMSNAHIQGKEKVVMCHVDINTAPQNTDMRFTKDILGDFVNKGMITATNIIEGLEGLISHE